MSFSSTCSWRSNSSVIRSIWPCTSSNLAVNLAKGAARPSSFSHQLRSRRTSSSETEKPRIVVTIPRRLSPAGPTSLLRTPCSMDWLISCNSACAAEPKATIELVSAMSISSMRRRISLPTCGSACSSDTTSSARPGSGRTTAFTSSTSGSASCAFFCVSVDIVGIPLTVKFAVTRSARLRAANGRAARRFQWSGRCDRPVADAASWR